MQIKQVVVVEGKTDTSKLQAIFGKDNIKTIETNGRALNKKTLNIIAQINKTQGVIVFTDPDEAGIKIRDTINSHLNYKCFNAFILKKDINSSKKGIAEADNENIIKALENVVEFKGRDTTSLTWEEYLKHDFYLKLNRIKIAKYLNWNDQINSKKLFKWLNLLNLTVIDIKMIIGE